MSYQNTGPATRMPAVGDRFGTLTVREVLCGAEVGHPHEGTFCWVRCEHCGVRRLVRARHLRAGLIKTCVRRGRWLNSSDGLTTSARVAHRLADG